MKIKCGVFLLGDAMIKSISLTLVLALLFTAVAPPIAEANIWDERRKAVELMQEKKSKMREALRPRRLAPRSAVPALGVLGGEGFTLPAELGSVSESWHGKAGLEAQS